VPSSRNASRNSKKELHRFKTGNRATTRASSSRFSKTRCYTSSKIYSDAKWTRCEIPPPSPETQQTYERDSGPYSGEILLESPQSPFESRFAKSRKLPSFDGYNISLSQFIRACRRAREMVPASAEITLTKINKLRGRAYYAVEEPCETISQLTDLLSGAFGPRKSVDQCRGELTILYHRAGEHTLARLH